MTNPPPDEFDGALDEGAPPRRKRSVGRIVGISVFGVIAGLLVIAVLAAGFVVYTIQRSFPQLEGTVVAAGLDDEVTVQRDVLGIPVITASTTDDLFFAQGYVHAQDRFWEMDFRRHVTAGRLSELFGSSQLPTDRFLRTLGWRQVAEQEVEALGETERAYYDAYAAGVNAYLAENQGADASFEYAVLGLQNADYEIEPWTAADSVAWLKAMAWDLRSNLEEETQRGLLASRFTGEELEALYPEYPYDEHPVIVPTITDAPAPLDPETVEGAPASIAWTEVGDVLDAVAALVGDTGEGIGSNSWVVAGRLTESGMPLLANDPHLGAGLPNVWHQSALRCEVVSPACPFDVTGFGFAGVPGVIIGHNDRIAWGFTNLTTDVADLYIESIDGDTYLRDGEAVPLEVRTETLKVAGGDDEELVIRSTANGPIVSGLTADFDAMAADPYVQSDGSVVAAEVPAGEPAVSLRWTALTPGTTATAIFALNTAQDFAGFRAAAALFDVPAQNLVYADVDGNIGYQTPGQLPIRGAGDGWMPQPGWDSAYDWQGFIPFEELPVSYNPAEGYVVTANNALVDQTYPYFLSRDFDYGYRAARIDDLLQRRSANGGITIQDMRDIQADDDFAIGRRLSVVLTELRTGRQGPDAALEQLRLWDGQNRADSAPAAFMNVLWDELVANIYVRGREEAAPVTDQARMFLLVTDLLEDPESPWWQNDALEVSGMNEMLILSVNDAYDRLVTLQGDNPARWNWGGLHALPLRSDTFGSSGIAPIEMLFNRGPYPTGGGSSVVNATGWVLGQGFQTVTVPSMRMIVDLSDFDASRWNQLTGTSGHTFHPNYVDQVETWQRVEHTPWAFTPEAVDAATTHTLVLTPED